MGGRRRIALDIGRSRDELTAEIYRTLLANGTDGEGVHVRLVVTRGRSRRRTSRDEVIAAGQTSWPAVVAGLTAPVEGIC